MSQQFEDRNLRLNDDGEWSLKSCVEGMVRAGRLQSVNGIDAVISNPDGSTRTVTIRSDNDPEYVRVRPAAEPLAAVTPKNAPVGGGDDEEAAEASEAETPAEGGTGGGGAAPTGAADLAAEEIARQEELTDKAE